MVKGFTLVCNQAGKIEVNAFVIGQVFWEPQDHIKGNLWLQVYSSDSLSNKYYKDP